jgi:hypothetical protein
MTGTHVYEKSPTAEPTAWPQLDVAELRHPSEPSRFALAMVASSLAVAVGLFVLASLGKLTVLLALMVVIGFVVLVFWVGLQIWRIRLLGDAVLVSATTPGSGVSLADVSTGGPSHLLGQNPPRGAENPSTGSTCHECRQARPRAVRPN